MRPFVASVSLDRRMPPGVAERHAAERKPARPDGTEMLQQRVEDARRRQAAVLGLRERDSRKAARPRPIVLREHRRRCRDGGAEPREQVRTACDAEEFGLPDMLWKPRAMSSPVSSISRSASARSGSDGSAEKPPPRTYAGSRPRGLRSAPITCSVAASRYFQGGPAPASSSTDVIARSNSARPFAAGESHGAWRRALTHRSRPPKAKWRQRAWNGTFRSG